MIQEELQGVKALKQLLKSVEEQKLDPSMLEYCFPSKFQRQVWNSVSQEEDQILTDQFIVKYKNWLNWGILSNKHKFTLNLLSQVEDKIQWPLFSSNPNLTEQIIRNYQDKINWYCLQTDFLHYKFSFDFIRQFKDKWDFSHIIRNHKVSMRILEEFTDKFNEADWYYYFSKSRKVYKRFIQRNLQKFQLQQIYNHQHLNNKLKERVLCLMKAKNNIRKYKI